MDSCVGNAIATGKFNKKDVLCTKTLYNYLHLGLLPFTVIDFPLIVKRSTMTKRSNTNKKILGSSIEERADHIENREEFGHWEIDTVIGKKTKDEVIMSIVERKTRHAIFVKIPSKTANDVNRALLKLQSYYGLDFNKIFKTITADNGSEFAGLTELGNKLGVPVYFAHPYSSFERGTNERHNGLLRRFLPKGKAISDYDAYAIQAIEEWMNTLPRKILGYRTPEDMFEEHLDEIYKQAA